MDTWCCCWLPCNHFSNWTWVVEEILVNINSRLPPYKESINHIVFSFVDSIIVINFLREIPSIHPSYEGEGGPPSSSLYRVIHSFNPLTWKHWMNSLKCWMRASMVIFISANFINHSFLPGNPGWIAWNGGWEPPCWSSSRHGWGAHTWRRQSCRQIFTFLISLLLPCTQCNYLDIFFRRANLWYDKS